jgi:hypothetical protein
MASAARETPGHAWSIARTLGAELERVRLAHRAERVERILASLSKRRDEQARVGAVSPALSRAIGDFSHELASLRAPLAETQRATAVARKPRA